MKRTHNAPLRNPPSHLLRLSLLRCAATLLAFALLGNIAFAESCTPQSALPPADRTALADTASTLATLVQANNATALQALAVPVLASDFASFQYLLGNTAPQLTGATLAVDQLYLLDASTLKLNPDGTAADAQFVCSLNGTTMQVEFSISALPPGRYAFAIVTSSAAAGAAKPSPWRLSFLFRQDAATNKWLVAGFYPTPTTAGGHDGLWYWIQAREYVTAKQPWNAWLYYRAAAQLLQPAPFVLTTHFDKLRIEAANAAPSALPEGVNADAPLVVKAASGVEYRFTALSVDDSLAQSKLDISAHLHVDSIGDPAVARKRNNDAAAALIAAYPELRQPFHGVWIYADAPGQNPFATEQPMSDIK